MLFSTPLEYLFQRLINESVQHSWEGNRCLGDRSGQGTGLEIAKSRTGKPFSGWRGIKNRFSRDESLDPCR